MENEHNLPTKIKTLLELSLIALFKESDLEKLETKIYAMESYIHMHVMEIINTLELFLEVGIPLRIKLVMIDILGRSQRHELTQILLTKINSKNTWIQAAVIEALGNLGNNSLEVISILEEQLSNQSKNKELIKGKALVALKKLDVSLDEVISNLYKQLNTEKMLDKYEEDSKEYYIAYNALSNMVPTLKNQTLLKIVEFLVTQRIKSNWRYRDSSEIKRFLENATDIQLNYVFLNLIHLLNDDTVFKNEYSISLVMQTLSRFADKVSDSNLLKVIKLIIPIVNNYDMPIANALPFHDAGIMTKLYRKLPIELGNHIKEYIPDEFTKKPVLETKKTANEILYPLIHRISETDLNELIELLIIHNKAEYIGSIKTNLIKKIPVETIFIIINLLFDNIENSKDKEVKDLSLTSLYKLITRIPSDEFIKAFKHFLAAGTSLGKAYIDDLDENDDKRDIEGNLSKRIVKNIPTDKIIEVIDLLKAEFLHKNEYTYESNTLKMELLLDLVNQIPDEQLIDFFDLALSKFAYNYKQEFLDSIVARMVEARFPELINFLISKANLNHSDRTVNDNITKILYRLIDRIPEDRIIETLKLLLLQLQNPQNNPRFETETNDYRNKIEIMEALNRLIEYAPDRIKASLLDLVLTQALSARDEIRDKILVKSVNKFSSFILPSMLNRIIELVLINIENISLNENIELMEIITKNDLLAKVSKSQVDKIIELLANAISVESIDDYSELILDDDCGYSVYDNRGLHIIIEAIGDLARYIPPSKIDSIKKLLLKKVITELEVETAINSIIKIGDSRIHGNTIDMLKEVLILYSNQLAKLANKDKDNKSVIIPKIIQLAKNHPEIIVNDILRSVMDQNAPNLNDKIASLAAMFNLGLPIEQNELVKNVQLLFDKTKSNKEKVKLDAINKLKYVAEYIVILKLDDMLDDLLAILFNNIKNKELKIKKVTINTINDLVEYIPKIKVTELFRLLSITVKDKNSEVREVSLGVLAKLAIYNQEFLYELIEIIFITAKDTHNIVKIATIESASNILSYVPDDKKNDLVELFSAISLSSVSSNWKTKSYEQNRKFEDLKADVLKRLTKRSLDDLIKDELKSFFQSLYINEDTITKLNKIAEKLPEKITNNEILELLININSSGKLDLRLMALEHLMDRIPEEKIIQTLIFILSEIKGNSYAKNQETIKGIMSNIPENKMIEVIDFLMLKIQDHDVKSIAQNMISNLISNKVAFRVLTSYLNSNNALVRKYAEEALSLMNTKDKEVLKISNTSYQTASSDLQIIPDNLQKLDTEKAEEQDNIFISKVGSLDPSIEIYQSSYNRQLGMRIVNVPGDGNCFFHAVEAQLRLLNNGEASMSYQDLRQFAINYIESHRQDFQDFMIDESVEVYLDRMSQNREWADHNIIHALSRELRINIVIIGNNHIDIPQIIGSAEFHRTIYLGHFVELHYVSLVEINDITAAERFQELEARVQQDLLSRNNVSEEQNTTGAVSGTNDLVVLNLDIKFSNLLLDHKTLLAQTYKLGGIEAVDQLLELSVNKDIEEQILLAIDELGIEKVLEIFLDNNAVNNEKKDGQTKDYEVITKALQDQQTLETIAQIEAIIGKEALNEITGFYKYVSAALCNNQLSNSSTKVLNIIGALINNLEEWLDFSNLYENIDIENQITLILTQLENWFDFIASGTTYIELPPRYPGFDPDYYNGGGFGGGNEGDGHNSNLNNHESADLFIPLFVGQTNTTVNATDV